MKAPIHIQAGQSLGEVSSAFHQVYPYLKLAFFDHGHAEGHVSARADQLSVGHILRPVEAHVTTLEIEEHMTVTALESQFQAVFGIGAQVLRQSGGLWLQTGSTDHWTLTKQHAEGERDSLMTAEGI
ncbi:MAG: hypothetical protein SF053_14765 [Bacteroidia bacterium]|nr:hypothetical protein [Bacteroidia bacterium]